MAAEHWLHRRPWRSTELAAAAAPEREAEPHCRTPLQPPTVPFCFVRCPHTSAPQKAAGGVVLLPTPFLCSKSKSLFLRSSGCQPAVRQPDGKARGLSSLPGSLAAGGPSASRGLPLELCQALGAHCYGLELSSAAYAWPVVLQPCPGARCWVEGLSSCPPPPIQQHLRRHRVLPAAWCLAEPFSAGTQPVLEEVGSGERWGGGCSLPIRLFKGSEWAGEVPAASPGCQPFPSSEFMVSAAWRPGTGAVMLSG